MKKVTTSTKKIIRNTGKIEFLANLEEIKQMMNAGYNYKNIHSKMLNAGRFSMSYFTFCYHLRTLNADQKTKKVVSNPLISPPTTKDKFIKPVDIEISELI